MHTEAFDALVNLKKFVREETGEAGFREQCVGLIDKFMRRAVAPKTTVDQQVFLDWRGIQDACEECQGTGIKVYGSTAVFWGGIGGQAMTQSVCDHCWGSGDKYRPWKSWKLIKQEMDDRAPMFRRLQIAAFKLI